MYKCLIVFCLALGHFFNGFSQSKTAAIGISKLRVDHPEYAESAAELQSQIIEILSTKKNIKLLDKSNSDVLDKELDEQKNIKYLRGLTVAQDKAIGATILLTGSFNSIAVNGDNVNAPKGNKGVLKDILGDDTKLSMSTCKLRFSINIIDVETGVSIGTKSFDITSKAKIGVSNKNFEHDRSAMKAAVSDARKAIEKELSPWITELFPPGIKFYSVDKYDKKGFAEKVSVMPDNGIELSKGTLITVFEVIELEVDGVKKKRKVEISTLKVIANEGDFISCEVKDGEEKLESTWKNGKIQLNVKGKK